MKKFILKKLDTLQKVSVNTITGYIYMLHRVGDKDNQRLISNENMKVSVGFLENFIISGKREFDFISLYDLCDIYAGKKKLHKKFIVLTFDDGYADNFELAFPILKKHNVPFTIYVSTGLIDRKSILWWYKLDEYLLKHDVLTLSDGTVYDCSDKLKKESVFLSVREKILTLNADNFLNELNELIPDLISTTDNYYQLMMNWNQIKTLSNEPLCTIAAHTVNHLSLKQLSDKKAIAEILEGKIYLEEMIGKKVDHFAYPFGTSFEVSEITKEIASNAEFRTIAVSNGGEMRKFDKNLLNLKRMMLIEK
jgi:peptidoglycan/xylan/chitin deacetylase (PgdA/CDA1 family)